MAVILVGFMGAGKTTVGRQLAAQLGVAHHDLDDLIVEAAGCSIPEIFAARGDAGFRALEHETLLNALDIDGVLSTGGGAPVQPQNFALLKASSAPVVLLEAKPATILQRIGADANRPLVQELGQAGLVALQAQRDPRYHELADLVIATDTLTPTEIALQIRDWLATR
ncbi:shikimate kinase [Lacticaseibacillus jixiensis]|uniref:shikimate kinase n=1 Tax=Lacticaseibacillus jixiensis TaxID=3231926 RepID=UPI0036F36C64